MEIGVIAMLIGSGIVVGVINTFAGAGAVITITLFSFLGLPLSVANATNRIPVLFQTVTMSVEFWRQKQLDFRLGIKLVIPTICGAVVGSEVIQWVDTTIFAWLLAGVLSLLLLVLVFDPSKALRSTSANVRPKWIHYIILVGIGFYGGAFHIGVGYLFLALFIVGLGYDLIQANALKGFVVLGYTMFSLTVFALNGEINWTYGLVHGIGNLLGAYFATRYVRHIPIKVLRYFLIVFIALTIVYILETV